MPNTYRLLHVEDSAEDAALLRFALDTAKTAYSITRVENEAEYEAQLDRSLPDVILCDYALPNFSAERALEITHARKLDLPFIIVSHHLDETAAVVAMQQGASDYLPKRNLGRLPKAIDAAVDRVRARRERIRDREAARAALEEANARLQTISKRMLALQEDERRAISRELHDDIGQTLSALKIGLHRLGSAAPRDAAVIVAECLEAANQALEKLRLLAMDLRPPQLDQLGLGDALEWLAQRQSASCGVAVRCELARFDARPSPGVESACYRIVQEALNNAVRHAHPSVVTIEVESDGSTTKLAVNDDGGGFDVDAARVRAVRTGSMGLIGMEERAQLAGGRLAVRSAPGAGTTIAATFPA